MASYHRIEPDPLLVPERNAWLGLAARAAALGS
jgi:hypothetical protein